MYLRVINEKIEYPYTLSQLKVDKYNVSFPKEITNEMLEGFGMYIVNPTPKPNDYTKNIIEDMPELIDGNYYQKWKTEDSNDIQIQTRIEFKWDEIRTLRNELLLECDWRVLTDSPAIDNIDEWISYRNSLRNITKQQNPFFIVWPTQPN